MYTKYLSCSMALVVTLLLTDVLSAAEEYYFRPYEETQGSGAGTTYDNAWHQMTTARWDTMAPGDTLYICGIHDEVQDSRIVLGTAGTTGNVIILDGNCPLPGGGFDQGIVLNTGTRLTVGGWTAASWPDTYYRGYGGSTGSRLLELSAGGTIEPTGSDLTSLTRKSSFPDFITLTDNGDGTATLDIIATTADVGLHELTVWVWDKNLGRDAESFTVTVGSVPGAQPAVAATSLVDSNKKVNCTSAPGDIFDTPPELGAIGNIQVTPDVPASVLINATDIDQNHPVEYGCTESLRILAGSMPNDNWACGNFEQVTAPHPVTNAATRLIFYKPFDTPANPGICGSPQVTYAASDAAFHVGSSSTSRDYVTLRNLHLLNGGVRIINSDHVTVDNTSMRWGGGITANKSHFGTVTNSEIWDTPGGIYPSDGGSGGQHDGWIISNNHIHDIYGSTDSHCIGFQGGSVGTTIEYNHLHDCEGSGITLYSWAYGDLMKDNVIRYNYIHDVLDTGRGGSNQRGIEHGSSNCPQHPDDTTGNIIAYNLLVNVGGIAFRTKTSKPTTPGVFAWSYFNNAVFGSGSSISLNGWQWYEDAAYQAGAGNGTSCAGSVADHQSILSMAGSRTQNNIFVNPANEHVFNIHIWDLNASGLTMDRNIYYSDAAGSGSPYFTWWDADNLSTACTAAGAISDTSSHFKCHSDTLNKYRNFLAAAGFPTLEQNSLDVDPLFVNASLSPASEIDFALQEFSPAIDQGENVGQSVDYLGNPVYGAPDLGLLEFQPPYSMGTDMVDVAADIRIYTDGKYRNRVPPTGTVANLQVAPVGGWPTGDYSLFLDFSVSAWETSGFRARQWTATPGSATDVVYTVGDLKPNHGYVLQLDSVNNTSVVTDAGGQFSFPVNHTATALVLSTVDAGVGTDTDVDGLSDDYEQCFDGDCTSYDPYDPVNNPAGTDLNSNAVDTDQDGYTDGEETFYNSDPLDAGSTAVIVADGDVNQDGAVNVADVLLAQRYILGIGTLTQAQIDHGDFKPAPNVDGDITLPDVLIIIKTALTP